MSRQRDARHKYCEMYKLSIKLTAIETETRSERPSQCFEEERKWGTFDCPPNGSGDDQWITVWSLHGWALWKLQMNWSVCNSSSHQFSPIITSDLQSKRKTFVNEIKSTISVWDASERCTVKCAIQIERQFIRYCSLKDSNRHCDARCELRLKSCASSIMHVLVLGLQSVRTTEKWVTSSW